MKSINDVIKLAKSLSPQKPGKKESTKSVKALCGKMETIYNTLKLKSESMKENQERWDNALVTSKQSAEQSEKLLQHLKPELSSEEAIKPHVPALGFFYGLKKEVLDCQTELNKCERDLEEIKQFKTRAKVTAKNKLLADRLNVLLNEASTQLPILMKKVDEMVTKVNVVDKQFTLLNCMVKKLNIEIQIVKLVKNDESIKKTLDLICEEMGELNRMPANANINLELYKSPILILHQSCKQTAQRLADLATVCSSASSNVKNGKDEKTAVKTQNAVG